MSHQSFSMNQMGAPKGLVRIMLILWGGVFVLSTFAQLIGHPLTFFWLRGEDFFHGHLYQLLTCFLVHDSIVPLIFNGLCLWFLGTELENLWGPRKTLVFYIFCAVGILLTYLLVCLFSPYLALLSFSGSSALCFALLAAYAFLFPRRPMLFMMTFPMPAKTFCLLLMGVELYFLLLSRGVAVSFSNLMAALYAYLFVKIPYPWRPFSLLKKAPTQKKNKFHLVQGGESSKENSPEKSPKYWQ